MRHFIGWFQNSIPPRGIIGKVFEVYTMFFNRFLTKEGIEHKNQFIRWFGLTLLLGSVWVFTVALIKNGISS